MFVAKHSGTQFGVVIFEYNNIFRTNDKLVFFLHNRDIFSEFFFCFIISKPLDDIRTREIYLILYSVPCDNYYLFVVYQYGF